MFGKLLKNDLKAQWHSVDSIFFIVGILAAVLALVNIFAKEQETKVFVGIGAFFVTLFIFVFIIFTVGGMFSKTMFGKAGYLTLTLPVKTSSLIWSKTVSGLVWVAACFGVFLLSTVFLYKTFIDTLGTDAATAADSLLILFGGPSLKTIVLYLAYFAVELIIISFALVQCIYFGITLSSVAPFSKLGKFGKILFIVISIYLVNELSTRLGNLLPIGMCIATDEIIFTSNVIDTINSLHNSAGVYLPVSFTGPAFKLIFAILLNIPTTYLVKNEVNVQ